MSDIIDRYAKLKGELKPHYEALIRAAHERGLFVTGFVYGDLEPQNPAGPLLIRFGNIWGTSPAEMFLIHYQLASMAAQMEHEGHMEREITHIGPAGELSQESGPPTPNSLELADKLVLMLISTPSEMLPDNIDEILKQYADSRKPEGK